MAKKIILESIEIPKNLAEMVFNRTKPYLEKYHEDQRLQSVSLIIPFKNLYDIKQLCFSCYSQGLSDAQQVLEK